MKIITSPYILFTRIPFFRFEDDLFCDPLWEKDLRLHLDYIENFGLCCPVVERGDISGLKRIEGMDIKWIFELKKDEGLKSVVANLIPNFWQVIKACRIAKITHSGGAGWAFPLSFYLLLLHPFLPFQWIIVVESSFWMIEKGEKKTLRKLIEHGVHKLLLKNCVRTANARIFTQSFYQRYFLGEEKERSLINPATWVDENSILSNENFERQMELKNNGILKIIYPSRLEDDKGVFVVLGLIDKMRNTTCGIQLSIMGDGKLKGMCASFIENYRGSVVVDLIDPVPYGEEFFKKIRKYDFLLVPVLKQEQPRIIFDAFSQGVPIIGSDTSGVRDIANENNAVFFQRGDVEDLKNTIERIAENRDLFFDMGMAGLTYARGRTHFQMHKDRSEFLARVLKTDSSTEYS